VPLAPRVLVAGSFILPTGTILAVVGLIGFAASAVEGSDLMGAFAVVMALGGIATVAGGTCLTIGMVHWLRALRRNRQHLRALPRVVVAGLDIWIAAAVAFGVWIVGGIWFVEHAPWISLTVVASLVFWIVGAIAIATGTYKSGVRTDNPDECTRMGTPIRPTRPAP